MSDVWRRGEFEISTNHERLDYDVLHDFLSRASYWAQGRTRAVIKRSVENSLAFGVYRDNRQIGFARVVTDYATFAWLADVFVLEEARGLGLAKWLVAVIVAHPELQNMRRWVLATKDAHELYRRFGFTELAQPARWMEIFEPQGALTTNDRTGATSAEGARA